MQAAVAKGHGRSVDPLPIARLRYTKAASLWSLYWRDRHLRFHLYDRLGPSPRIEDLLREVDRDPTSIFWG
jgi:hypothetical protein